MNTATIESAAATLRKARVERRPVPRISETHGIDDVAAAYAVANLNTRLAVKAGRRITGRKIGLTSRAVQQQLGVDQPDYGVLFSDMEFLSGSEVPLSRLIQPKAEGEIAFTVGRDLDSDCLSWARFLQGLEYALPAIEIVDSAILDWRLTLVDTIADNASCGLYVLGLQPVAIASKNLGLVGMDLRKNGQTVGIGTGVACMDSPLLAAYWLATTMQSIGEPLRAGDVILSGALGPMVTISVGDTLEVSIGDLGTVACDTC